MRSFRAARLLVLPALVLPLMLSAILLPGTAWAKGGVKPVTCPSVTGTYSGNWSLMGCFQKGKQGGFSVIGTGNDAISVPFTTSSTTVSATITWGQQVNRHVAPLVTHITYTVTQEPTKKDKCRDGTEYAVAGRVGTSSPAPGIKAGKLKIFVCNTSGALSSLKRKFKL